MTARTLRFVSFFALSALGGLAAAALGLPVPFMLGAVLVSAVLGVSWLAPARVPGSVSVTARVAIGVLIGASIEPDLLQRLPQIGPAALAVPLQVALALWLGSALLRRTTRMTHSERLLGSLPGGFATVVMSIDALGHDVRRISMYHAIRVLVTLLSFPLLLAWGLAVESPAVSADRTGLADLDLRGAGLYLFLCAAGWAVDRWTRLPAGTILIPLALAVAANAAIGLPDVPREAIPTVQVVLGSLIGLRFADGGFAGLRNCLWTGLLLTVAVLVLSLAFAVAVHLAAGMPLGVAVLAFAPGGLPEISVLALSLGQDPALVVTIHAWRMVVVLLTLPLLLRWMKREDEAERTREGGGRN